MTGIHEPITLAAVPGPVRKCVVNIGGVHQPMWRFCGEASLVFNTIISNNERPSDLNSLKQPLHESLLSSFGTKSRSELGHVLHHR